VTDLRKDHDSSIPDEEDEDREERGWSPRTGITCGRFHMSTEALFVLCVAAYFIVCVVLNGGGV